MRLSPRVRCLPRCWQLRLSPVFASMGRYPRFFLSWLVLVTAAAMRFRAAQGFGYAGW